MERARALLQARDLDGAARAYGEVLAADPARAEAWFMQGVIHAERRDAREARVRLARAFELQPSQSPANHLVYANVLLEAGESRPAEIEARKVVAASPWLPPALAARAHATLAGALIARGTFAEAVDILQAALQRSPADPTLTRQLAYARWRLARSLHASARVFDAIDEYRAALALCCNIGERNPTRKRSPGARARGFGADAGRSPSACRFAHARCASKIASGPQAGS